MKRCSRDAAFDRPVDRAFEDAFVLAIPIVPSGSGGSQLRRIRIDVDTSPLPDSALFIAATQMGAVAEGQEAEPWEELGARIGEAFQLVDDLLDWTGRPEVTGKPAGLDLLEG